MVAICAGLLVMGVAAKEILDGEAMTRGTKRPIRRDEQPGKFWTVVLSQMAFGIFLLLSPFIRHPGK